MSEKEYKGDDPGTRMLRVTKITSFIFETGIRVEFFPITNVPGFTHKVFVMETADGKFKFVAKDWFSPVAGRISKKTAKFFYDKHIGHSKG
jgi:hypothetical protein